jgi:hypothetical protein
VPEHHTGGGEWTRNTVAAADNAGIQWRDSLPIPLPDPASVKPTEPKPESGLATEIYNATLRAPVRDIGHLIEYPEEIPNAIAGVAPGLGPVGEIPVAIAELLTALRALGGVVAEGAAGTAVVESSTPEGIVYLRTDLTGKLAPYGGQSINEAHFLARQIEHARTFPDSKFEFIKIDRANPGAELDVAEHNFIQELTSGVAARRSPAVSNLRDPIGPARRPKLGLPEPK